jgi:hypothetical protein
MIAIALGQLRSNLRQGMPRQKRSAIAVPYRRNGRDFGADYAGRVSVSNRLHKCEGSLSLARAPRVVNFVADAITEHCSAGPALQGFQQTRRP